MKTKTLHGVSSCKKITVFKEGEDVMNPVLRAFEQDMSTDPEWIPTPELRRKLMLSKVAEELRKKVSFIDTPEKVTWDKLFISDDETTVGVRAEFGGKPSAILFKFNERAEPISITGRGVETIDFDEDRKITKRSATAYENEMSF